MKEINYSMPECAVHKAGLLLVNLYGGGRGGVLNLCETTRLGEHLPTGPTGLCKLHRHRRPLLLPHGAVGGVGQLAFAP